MTTPKAPILTAVLLSIAPPLLAQPPNTPDTPDTPDKIDRIIVTGARAPIDASRIGNATSIITREDIERRQARYLADLLRAEPGFAISASGGVGSQTQARVRGSEANHVLVLIDGVRANDPATDDEFRWEYLATGNVERVEIVRGPQSALWGSESIGAVVNVITRKGSDKPAADGYMESGSNGTRNIGANVSGPLGDWTLSASAESLETEGTNISRTGDEKDGANLDAVTIRMRYEGSDKVGFDAMLRATDATSQFDPVDFVTTGLPTDGNLQTQSDSLVGNVSASIATGGRVVWRLRAARYDSGHDNFTDGVADSSTASQRLTYSVGADLGLGRNELSLALEHEDTAFEQRGQVVFGDPNQDQDMQVTSAIGEYRWLAGKRLTWILSGRYDSNSDFEDVLTGKLSAAYRSTPTTTLRGSIGTGQKAPTFIDRFGYFPAQFIGNPDLKPESSMSYDIGIDKVWPASAITFSASLYWQKLDDEIDGFVFDPGALLFTARNRSDESSRQGVELSTDWRPGDTVVLGLSYTYTDATEQNGQGETVAELRRPRHSGGISLSFDPPGSRFQAMLLADYGGERDDIFYPPFPEPAQRMRLPDYWIIDATARFRLTESVVVFARATNLLDEKHEQVYGYRAPGRAAYLGIQADLGR